MSLGASVNRCPVCLCVHVMDRGAETRCQFYLNVDFVLVAFSGKKNI